ncbi:MAG TPA: TetR/AcrR family transcriptional regulator [Acidimicrobiales bacterium]|nr:TetR/AcrR family transcriptional regulator [Acidimicrobiales bacterium]
MPRPAASRAAPGRNGHGTPDGPRSRKGAATRARLLDAAKTVFERDGFLNARIIDIADTAGLKHGSFYHYFDSKEQIFREVAEAQEERLTAPPSEGPRRHAGAGASPRDRIRAANRRYLERYRDEARLMGVIEQVSRYDDRVNAARMATQRHFAERAEAAIRRLQDEGAADPQIDPGMAADALGAMVARFAELWLVQGYRRYAFDDAVEQLTRLWANALGLEDEGRPRTATARRTTTRRTATRATTTRSGTASPPKP